MDLNSSNLDIEDCALNTSNNTDFVGENLPEILNLECSPIPRPGSSNLHFNSEIQLLNCYRTPVSDSTVKLMGKFDQSVKILSDVSDCNSVDKKYDCLNVIEFGDLDRTLSSSTNDINEIPSNNSINQLQLVSKDCMISKPIDEPFDQSRGNVILKVEGQTDIGLQSPLSNNINHPKDGISDMHLFSCKTKETQVGLISQITSKENSNHLAKSPDIYCSTPIVSTSTFEQLNCTPLNTNAVGLKTNLKRKNLQLECIKEVNEDNHHVSYTEKKVKISDSLTKNIEFKAANSQDISALHCFEPPAKSILKKWQPSCLSRNVGPYFVIDECGECDEEDSSKVNMIASEPITNSQDDFEVAYKSLTEELMKGSSNIETLEKYHSHVQLESQMDDEKFDEVLQELTLTYELDEKTSLSLKTMEESVLTDNEKTFLSLKGTENINENLLSSNSMSEGNTTAIEVTLLDKGNTSFAEGSNLNATNNATGIDGINNVILNTKEETRAESSESKDDEMPRSSTYNARLASDPKKNSEKLSILYADEKDMTMDEEDFLLEEDISSKKKPYVFFEFVSSDPKENEDNYNPEWQKLGRLTSDEERYKAVRDRWRSLIPPDPNRNLTCRQWRERNRKPPLNLPSLNNNHQLHQDSERNQLCTAVFDNKIKKIVQDLEDRRLNILRKRSRDFEQLAQVQDKEQTMLTRRGGSALDMAILHKHHIEECRKLKISHDSKIKRITEETEAEVRLLKNASDEVLLFQKFYKGVGASDDEVCLYMTDIQAQELMETEDMLEQYSKFYQ